MANNVELHIRKLFRRTVGHRIGRLFSKAAYAPRRNENFIGLFNRMAETDQYADLLECSNKIIGGNYSFLGFGILQEPLPDWHLDYLSGHRWPLLPAYSVRASTPECVDIKNPWEMASFFHFFPVSAAYRITEKTYYKEFVFQQLEDFISKNPPGIGVNWCCPMVVAFRLILLIESIAPLLSVAPESLQNSFDKTVWDHILFILFNLENLGGTGNHYLANVLGVLWGSFYFSERNRFISGLRRWAIRQLSKEILLQTNSDGFNYEGSSSYHRLVSEMFLYAAIFLKKNHVPLSKTYMDRLHRMLDVLRCLMLPNGFLPLIGDGDDCRIFTGSDYFTWNKREGQYLLNIGAVFFNMESWYDRKHSKTAELSNWIFGTAETCSVSGKTAGQKTGESTALASSQIYVSRNGLDCLVINCNHPGIASCGHSHNDSLSFVYCVDGTEVIVDPGTCVYTRNRGWRNRFRSTRAHNVIRLNGEEQWPIAVNAPFYLPKERPPRVRAWETCPDGDLLEGEHYGYMRLPERVIHRRTFHHRKEKGVLVIRDLLLTDGTTDQSAFPIEMFLHLSAEVEPVLTKNQLVITRTVDSKNICTLNWTFQEWELEIQDDLVSEQYGTFKRSKTLVFRTVRRLPFSSEILFRSLRRSSGATNPTNHQEEQYEGFSDCRRTPELYENRPPVQTKSAP